MRILTSLFALSTLSYSCLASQFEIVDRFLDNKDCQSGVTHRTWQESYKSWNPSDPSQKPEEFKDYDDSKRKFIVLLYTAGANVDGTYATYNQRGVSAHYLLDNNKTIFHAVNEETDIAYGCGESNFAGIDSLNYWSIIIDHSHPGHRPIRHIYGGYGEPVQLQGDSRWWYPFSEEQFVASSVFTKELQTKHKIPGYSVVTHADIAPSRKQDIGPMWDYKRSFEEYGVGFFPSETHQIDMNEFSEFSDDDYLRFIGAFGYNTSEANVIQAYQFHYSASNISGELVDTTKQDILKHVVSLYDYKDKTTGTKYEFFHEKLGAWTKENPEKAAAFNEYFNKHF